MISADQARSITRSPDELAFQDALQKNETIIRAAAANGQRMATLYDGPNRLRMTDALVAAGYTVHNGPGCLRVTW